MMPAVRPPGRRPPVSLSATNWRSGSGALSISVVNGALLTEDRQGLTDAMRRIYQAQAQRRNR